MTTHEPVLVQPLIAALCTDPAGTYVDGTFGRGGHSRALAVTLRPEARLLVIDRDPQAVAEANRFAANDERVIVRQGRLSDLLNLARGAGFETVIGVMFDLGVSSPQLDDPSRGFSFRSAGPLDMRMNPDEGTTAAEWLNSAGETELAQAFREFGEERYARRIARAIVERRQSAPLAVTTELVEVITAAQPRPDPHKHAATRVFQAVRIVVNDELTELARGLEGAFDLLAIGGRLAVLSFHSLEDRIVKRTFAEWVKGPSVPRRLPIRGAPISRARLVQKPMRADAAEVARNPRARSATLRVVEKCA